MEIIKPSQVLSPETVRVLRNNTRNPLVNDLVPFIEFWDAEKTIGEFRKYYSLSWKLPASAKDSISANFDNLVNDSLALPDMLVELVSAGNDGLYALSAFGGCLFYLRQAFLDETLLNCAKFEPLPCSDFCSTIQNSYMILDAAALENLEILENNRNGGPTGYVQVTTFNRLRKLSLQS